ncbi:MAG: hypothetical protein QW734_02130 [Candidatus Bathyarchaeia archaeon]
MTGKPPQCLATQPCQKETPWGTVKGFKCQLSDELYHNTTLEKLKKIIEDGKIKVPREPHDLLGQDAISLSSCPTQTYGGTIKLVIPSKAVSAHPMCYYNPNEHPQVEKGLDEEAQKKINGYAGPNRVRSWHQVNSNVYSKECEYIVYHDIPTSNIKRVEYWIPWQPGMPTFNVSCENVYPRYIFDQLGRDPTETIIQEIQEAKKLAQKIGAEFDVKSCFTSVKTGWKNYGYQLTKENLEKLKRGIKPESHPNAVTETCLC